MSGHVFTGKPWINALANINALFDSKIIAFECVCVRCSHKSETHVFAFEHKYGHALFMFRSSIIFPDVEWENVEHP